MKPFRKAYEVINLGRLQRAIDAGKIDAGQTIDAAVLGQAGLIGKVEDGVRLLAQGEITSAITISVSGASAAAIAAVEKSGGKVIVPVAAEAAAA